MRYYVGGFTWNGVSQLDRFLEDGVWENGYQEDKYSELFSQIKVGDSFALKSTFATGRKPNGKSVLRIKNIGFVTAVISKSAIKIDWKKSTEFDLTDIKWYANTLEEISFPGDIERIFGKVINDFEMDKKIKLLTYKKQIILQGPPGTGKTRLAKEIAIEMIGNTGDIDLKNYLKKGSSIPNASGTQDYYFLENMTANSVELSSERATKKWSASFNKIQEKLLQLQNGEAVKNKGGDDPYVLAVAKYVFEKVDNSSVLLEDNEQYKLIQFHPSYTYEDFVRGIVATPSGNSVIYDSANKIFGKFAKEALSNYINSKKSSDLISKESWASEKYELFKDSFRTILEDSSEVLIKKGIKPKIIAVEEDSLRVNRYSNENDSILVKDNDIILAYIGLELSTELIKIKENINLSKSARSGMSYVYQNLVTKFKDFLVQNSYNYTPSLDLKTEQLRKYIFIIDEINRANLSSVLGELIYALEYRGKEVESMYEVDGSHKLILPPNLYIIGTMNTADRSVGHVDYAIRRRFAFVDVLPNIDPVHPLLKEKFIEISGLFVKNFTKDIKSKEIENAETLATEFRAQDVWIGHSYFICKNEDGTDIENSIAQPILDMKMQYEIIPILEEYVKDGILLGSVKTESLKMTVADYIKSLKTK